MKKYLKPTSGRLHSAPKFELETYRIRSKLDNHSTATFGVLPHIRCPGDTREMSEEE